MQEQFNKLFLLVHSKEKETILEFSKGATKVL